MGMSRAILFGGVRMVAFAMTAVGLGFDFSGASLLGFTSDGLRLMIWISFGTFFVLTGWREIDSLLQPRPRVEYEGLSPATVSTPALYFARLTFQNKSKTPLGQASTAQELAALIVVWGKNSVMDKWDGRWANTDRPSTTGDIWRLNRVDLSANTQKATLDIGYRIEGGLEFKGWDNLHYLEDKRVLIKPGHYALQVTLGAANWKERDFWYTLDVPNMPQSQLDQVKITRVKKSVIRGEGFQLD